MHTGCVVNTTSGKKVYCEWVRPQCGWWERVYNVLTAVTGSEWAGSVFRHLPVFTSQMRTLSSNYKHAASTVRTHVEYVREQQQQQQHDDVTRLWHMNTFVTQTFVRFTYWAWHDEIWLWIKVTAENVVTVTLQRLQTFSLKAALKNLFSKRHFKTAYALCTQHLCVLTRTVT